MSLECDVAQGVLVDDVARDRDTTIKEQGVENTRQSFIQPVAQVADMDEVHVGKCDEEEEEEEEEEEKEEKEKEKEEDEEEEEKEEEKEEKAPFGASVIFPVWHIAELMANILSFLDATEDLPVGRFVCRQWNAAILGWLSHLSSPLPPWVSYYSLPLSSSSFSSSSLCPSLLTSQQTKQPRFRESSFDMGYFASCHAFRNHLNVVRWARFVAGWHWDHRTCTEAARGGHFQVLAWAVANGCLWDDHEVCHQALRSARLDMVRWARAHGANWDMRASRDAVIGGRLAVLEWTRAHGCGCHEAARSLVSSANHKSVLRWARADDCPWPKIRRSSTIRSETIRSKRWAHAHGHPCRAIWLDVNASTSCLDVVKWGYANGFIMGATMCADAARAGRLDMLKWARQRGCPWREDAFFSVIESGRLDVVKWAYANGCTWSPSQGRRLIGSTGSMAIVRWLRQNGASFSQYTCSAIAAKCATERRIALFRWVCAHGCMWNKIGAAARVGHIALIEWALAHGWRCGAEICRSAICNSQWHVLAWAMSRRKVCASDTMDSPEEVEVVLCAAECGALDALAWLHERLSREALDLLYDPFPQTLHDTLCDVAAANGHLAIIRWARHRNHPWYESTCYVAAKHGHLSVLVWLRANDCPWNEAACLDIAVKMGYTQVLAWIIQSKTSTTSTTSTTLITPTSPSNTTSTSNTTTTTTITNRFL